MKRKDLRVTGSQKLRERYVGSRNTLSEVDAMKLINKTIRSGDVRIVEKGKGEKVVVFRDLLVE